MGDAAWALLCLVLFGVWDASMWPCAAVGHFHYCRAFCWVTIPQDLRVMHSFDGHLGNFYFEAIVPTAAMSNLVHISWCPHACVSVVHRPGSRIVMSRVVPLGDATTQVYNVVAQLPSHQQCGFSCCSTSCKRSIPMLQVRKTKRWSSLSQIQLVSPRTRICSLI